MFGKRTMVPVAGAALLLAPMFASMAGGPAVAGAERVSNGAGHQAGALEVSTVPLHVKLARAGAQAPTDAFCRKNGGIPCYSPQEIRHAYGVDRLLDKGYDGAGETIVIVDSFGSPTLASD